MGLSRNKVSVGEPADARHPKTGRLMHATQQEVMALLHEIGLHGQEAARALLLCGAPLDRDTEVVCR